MRKIYLSILFPLLLISCEKKQFYEMQYQANCTVLTRDIEDIAYRAMTHYYPKTKGMSIYDETVYPYCTEEGDTIAIVVDYGKGHGFVALSPDLETIYAVSDRTDFNSSPNMELFQALIMGIAANSHFPINPGIPIPPTSVEYVRDTVINEVNPMVHVHWHQHAPFNWYADNSQTKLAGCTPVAIAQIMSYYRYPETIDLTFPGASYTSINLDWDEMINNEGSHGTSCPECTQKANLLRQIGKICHASYSSNSTGAWPRVSYLNELGYTGNQSSSYSLSSIISSIDDRMPCIISAFSNDAGHSWVIDGYERTHYSCTTYEVGLLGRVQTDIVETEELRLHFNMGWLDNSCDTYYLALKHEWGSGSHIAGGSYDYYPVTMYETPEGHPYTDVDMLVTNIHPID